MQLGVGRQLSSEHKRVSANRHEVLVPRGHASANQVIRSFEVDKRHVRAIPDDDVPVGPLQRRAGEHTRLAPCAPAIDLFRDLAQPRQTIRIRQRCAVVHLLHIHGRMQIIAILELTAEHGRDERRDRGLA
jgi:hypothetical protein